MVCIPPMSIWHVLTCLTIFLELKCPFKYDLEGTLSMIKYMCRHTLHLKSGLKANANESALFSIFLIHTSSILFCKNGASVGSSLATSVMSVNIY